MVIGESSLTDDCLTRRGEDAAPRCIMYDLLTKRCIVGHDFFWKDRVRQDFGPSLERKLGQTWKQVYESRAKPL